MSVDWHLPETKSLCSGRVCQNGKDDKEGKKRIILILMIERTLVLLKPDAIQRALSRHNIKVRAQRTENRRPQDALDVS